MTPTTVPFFIPAGRYKHLDNPNCGSPPVFEQIPTEKDFATATSNIKWNGAEKRVVLDFDLLILTLSNGRNGGWHLFHEHSYRDNKTWFYVESVQTFEKAIQKIKSLLREEKEYISALLEKINRTLL